jgi:hypothetical protein
LAKDEDARMTHFIDWTLWGLLLIAATLEIIGDLAFTCTATVVNGGLKQIAG